MIKTPFLFIHLNQTEKEPILYFCGTFLFISIAWKPADDSQPVTAEVEMTPLHQQTPTVPDTDLAQTNNNNNENARPYPERKQKQDIRPRKLDWSQLPHELEY